MIVNAIQGLMSVTMVLILLSIVGFCLETHPISQNTYTIHSKDHPNIDQSHHIQTNNTYNNTPHNIIQKRSRDVTLRRNLRTEKPTQTKLERNRTKDESNPTPNSTSSLFSAYNKNQAPKMVVLYPPREHKETGMNKNELILLHNSW